MDWLLCLLIWLGLLSIRHHGHDIVGIHHDRRGTVDVIQVSATVKGGSGGQG